MCNRLFTCDIPLAQRYCDDRGVFPLAWCEWDATATGQLTALHVQDDPWAVEYRLPALSILELKVEGDLLNPRHGHRGRLEVSCEGQTRLLEGDDPRTLVETLARLLARQDPDVILTHWGDAWLLPMLQQLERRLRLPIPWHRDPDVGLKGRTARSSISSGRIVRRAAARVLAGRWHLDVEESVLLPETGLEGLIEVARLARLPVQRAARTAPGTAISSLHRLAAHRAGMLLPHHKQVAEAFQTAEELLTADKGGLVFVPNPGVYGNVAELDFASLYPAIMARYNISPETVGCACCPHHRVPELGRHTCVRRRGLVPQVLEPLLEKRARLKALKTTAPEEPARHRADRRQTALKWLLVTAFGYLGYKNFLFGKLEAHEAVTAYSREILLRAKERAEADGFTLVHALVDALWVTKPGMTPAAVAHLAEAIARDTGLPIAVEGLYRWLLFPPSRTRPGLAVPTRYVGVFQDGTLKVRGLECRRHDTPPFIARTQRAMLEVLAPAQSPEDLVTRLPEALEILTAAARQIREGRVPVHALAITKQLSKAPEAYAQPRDTAIVAQQLLARGVRLAPGEAVRFVITAAGDPDPSSRVRPLVWGAPLEGYDREQYVELLLRAAESILGPLGWPAQRLGTLRASEPRGRGGCGEGQDTKPPGER